jgi:hypothetical protein
MLHETRTSLPPGDVLSHAKVFFAERVPQSSAFLEKEGPGYATFRGQGGEEIALAVFALPEGTQVRASTLLFDQTVDRFFSTLPPVPTASG